MNNEKLIGFLTELTKLTYKYEFQIDGGNRLEWDEEKGCYRVDVYDGYDYHEPIYVYGNKEG